MNAERTRNSPKESPLPWGEGWGEGEPRSMTKRPVISSQTDEINFSFQKLRCARRMKHALFFIDNGSTAF